MSELIESKYCVVCMENSTNVNIGFTCRVCFDGFVCEFCFEDCFHIDERFDHEEPLVCPCCRSPDEFKDYCDCCMDSWVETITNLPLCQCCCNNHFLRDCKYDEEKCKTLTEESENSSDDEW